MEGKAVLFKKFAGIDSFDIEIDERDPRQAGRDRGGARADLRRHQSRGHQGARMLHRRAQAARADEDPGLPRRPARHRDHRGRRDPQRAAAGRQADRDRAAGGQRRRCRGAGLPRPAGRPGHDAENILVTDIEGVVYEGRTDADGSVEGALRAARPSLRTLAEAIEGADIFLGLSAAGVLKPEMVEKMAERPLILALANPNPEILPELAKEVRPDCDHRHRPLATTRTRSTTSCASRSSSGARSTSAPPRSTRR